jgi:hypothetical protein
MQAFLRLQQIKLLNPSVGKEGRRIWGAQALP